MMSNKTHDAALTDLTDFDEVLVTAAEMTAIEQAWFDAGMPIAALMEKAALTVANWLDDYFRHQRSPALSPSLPDLNPDLDFRLSTDRHLKTHRKIGILCGPGHNGGDALVVARELHLRGYTVARWQPFTKVKPLTQQHRQFADAMQIPQVATIADLADCSVIIDGIFGFGQTREVTGELAAHLAVLNQYPATRIAIDIPTGIHTDTGAVLGTAFQADLTLCLGLRKLGLICDAALPWVGQVEVLPFGLRSIDWLPVLQANSPDPSPINPPANLSEPASPYPTGLTTIPARRRWTKTLAAQALPLPRSPLTHKYREGHLLLICGSQQYIGAAILAGLGARSSGVGMLSIVVPQSLKLTFASQLPEAVIYGAPETATGAIADLPEAIDLSRYDAIACGCGLTTEPVTLIQTLLTSDQALLLDADALNILATFTPQTPQALSEIAPADSSAQRSQTTARSSLQNLRPNLKQNLKQNSLHPWLTCLHTRSALTVLTPHPGEFARLFPSIAVRSPVQAAAQAAADSGAIVVYKGARPAIARRGAIVNIIDSGTSGLARGGSGDVLAGFAGGLLATAIRQQRDPLAMVTTAVWWHGWAGSRVATTRSQLAVDGVTLAQTLQAIGASRGNRQD